jgi:hypothetical protein
MPVQTQTMNGSPVGVTPVRSTSTMCGTGSLDHARPHLQTSPRW